MKHIILGSASPRRRELLSQIGIKFEVRVSGGEEIYHSTVPAEIVKELALRKAENVAAKLEEETGGTGRKPENTLVLGADTIVVLEGTVLGKPGNEEDAFGMLRRLQGKSHEVYTGVAAVDFDSCGRKRVLNHAVGTKVFVCAMSEEEIRSYIATGEPMDKAGAYGIQGRFAPYIERIEGDYYNVVGLPLSYVYQVLKQTGAV